MKPSHAKVPLPGLTDPGTPAEVHAYLASLRENQGRLEEARHHLERAALFYRLLGDMERTARQLLKLGTVHYFQHEMTAAVTRELLEHAVTTLERAPRPRPAG